MEGSLIDLSRYRFHCSVEALEDAKIMFANGRYKNTLTRAYYAVFHAIRAVNSLGGFDSSKHSGVIAYFNQKYVKTEIFSKEVSKIIKRTYESRERADYLDFFIASREEAEEQIQRAEVFQNIVKQYLNEKGLFSADE